VWRGLRGAVFKDCDSLLRSYPRNHEPWAVGGGAGDAQCGGGAVKDSAPQHQATYRPTRCTVITAHPFPVMI
jgi:hypothetical protein